MVFLFFIFFNFPLCYSDFHERVPTRQSSWIASAAFPSVSIPFVFPPSNPSVHSCHVPPLSEFFCYDSGEGRVEAGQKRFLSASGSCLFSRYVAVSPLQRPVRRSVVCEVATKKPDSAVKRARQAENKTRVKRRSRDLVKRSYRMARVVKRKDERILTRLADEFEQLATQLNSRAPITMEIGKFTQACRLVSPLVQHFGVALKFADIEYSAEVNGIEQAGKSVNTLEDLLDREIQQNTMKDQSSASRSLIRVKRSLEMFKIIFEQTMASSGNSIMDPVNTAYKQVFYPYHGWATRKAVAGAVYTLPTKSLFLTRLKLDEASAFVLLQRIVTALAPLIHYIDNLFRSRESAQELLRLI